MPFERNGYIVLNKDDKYGLIDALNGNVVIPFEYEHLDDFSEDLIAAEKNQKYGFINIKNETVIPFPGGNIFANTYGYINTKGDIVIKAQFDDIEPFNNGFAAVKKDGKYGIINTKGEFVVPCEYGAIGYYEKTDTIIPLLDANYNQIAVYNIRKNLIRK